MGVRKAVLAGAVVAVAMLVGASQASALIFWTNTGSNADGTSIGRADLDGTNADNSFIGGQNHPCGIAVDDEHIYWAHRSSFPAGGIARADLDGTNVEQQFIDVSYAPCGVAVDDEHVYWADSKNGTGNTIGRADLDGENPDPDFITTDSGVCGLAVDDGHIYWGTRGSSGDIGRADLEGNDVDHHFVSEALSSCGVAVDDHHLYWGDISSSFGQGTVGKANLDGSGGNLNFIPNATGVGSPCGVAVDGDYVYWGDIGAMTGPSKVGRARLDGSDVEPSFIATDIAGCGVAVNDLASPPPVCTDGEVDAVAGAPTPVSLSCSGPGTLTFEVVDPPGHGAVGDLDSAAGRLTYTADPGYSGADSLTYRATNDAGPSNVATVSFSVAVLNEIRVGKAKLDKRRGTAVLQVRVPGAGRIALRGAGVKRQVKSTARARALRLKVRATGRKARKLRKRGKVAVKAKITYRPDGGDALTKVKRIKLVKKARGKRAGKKGGRH